MRSEEFWAYFDREARPNLAIRAETFPKIFDYLDRFDRPVAIVETGCVRKAGNWAGDGQSTVLFDKYAEFHPNSVVFSVDRDPQATTLCRSLVSERVRLHCGDSVAYLRSLTDNPPSECKSIDLLYLDSYDINNIDDPLPSAIHHLKELTAAAPLLGSETLVAVDDSPSYCFAIFGPDKSVRLLRPPRIGGKGKLIAEYAAQIGARSEFSGYQCGWTNLSGAARPSSPVSP